jgi:hypothetical protein
MSCMVADLILDASDRAKLRKVGAALKRGRYERHVVSGPRPQGRAAIEAYDAGQRDGVLLMDRKNALPDIRFSSADVLPGMDPVAVAIASIDCRELDATDRLRMDAALRAFSTLLELNKTDRDLAIVFARSPWGPFRARMVDGVDSSISEAEIDDRTDIPHASLPTTTFVSTDLPTAGRERLGRRFVVGSFKVATRLDNRPDLMGAIRILRDLAVSPIGGQPTPGRAS